MFGQTSRPAEQRRTGDLARAAVLRRFDTLASAALHSPIVAGRTLLTTLGTLTVVTAPLLGADAAAWRALGLVSVAMALVLAATFVRPWTRLSGRALLAFPVLALSAFTVLGIDRNGLFAPLIGYTVLCFCYTGLYQPRWSSLLVVPFSATAMLVSIGDVDTKAVVRVVISSLVQIILSEVLASFASRQADLSAALRGAAHTDALTGIPNRRDLESHLVTAVPGTSVIICDLDHFKALNDSHGHLVGDRVLADFGRLLRTSLRDGDFFARFGGEEFVLMLSAADSSTVTDVLARLHTQWMLMQPDVTFSAGVAWCAPDQDAAAALAAADRALYRAKAGGRNTDRYDAGVHATR